MLDLLITDAVVYNGTGSEPFRADVTVKDGKIHSIGRFPCASARYVVEAGGRALAPGFIDIHRHGDVECLKSHAGRLELQQGLTCVINGNCGISAAPICGKHAGEIRDYVKPVMGEIRPEDQCFTMEQYYAKLRQAQPGIHYRMLAGLGTIRAMTAGFDVTRLSEDHFRSIHNIMEQCLSQGAVGVSLGLGYAPDCYYTREELIKLLAPLSGGMFPVAVHMRNEGDGVVDSMKEILSVADQLRLRLQISHLKAIGQKNWKKTVPVLLKLMEEARESGVNVHFDAYPYTAGTTQLLHILPPEFLLGGPTAICRRLCDPYQRELLQERLCSGTDFENIVKLVGWENIYAYGMKQPQNRSLEGLSVIQIGSYLGKDPLDAVCDLLAAENCGLTMIDYITDREDVEQILAAEGCSIISDSIYPVGVRPHPRVHGSFVRVLEQYAGPNKLLTRPQAIRKMTDTPARSMGITGKGRIEPGYDGDMVMFDWNNLRETATYSDPDCSPEGIDQVFICGKPMLPSVGSER